MKQQERIAKDLIKNYHVVSDEVRHTQVFKSLKRYYIIRFVYLFIACTLLTIGVGSMCAIFFLNDWFAMTSIKVVQLYWLPALIFSCGFSVLVLYIRKYK